MQPFGYYQGNRMRKIFPFCMEVAGNFQVIYITWYLTSICNNYLIGTRGLPGRILALEKIDLPGGQINGP